jgi:hypothetical protein
VHRRLDEMAGKGRLLVLFREIAEFDRVLDDDLAFCRCFRERYAAVAR